MLTAVTTASFSFRGKSKKKMENTKDIVNKKAIKTSNTPKDCKQQEQKNKKRHNMHCIAINILCRGIS
jgi:hypothetical protein